MNIQGLNHFNIKAPQPLLQAVRDFYVEIIGLEEGFRPDFGVPGHWLYAGGTAVLHMVDTTGFGMDEAAPDGNNYLDHIAFTCVDIDATEAQLKEKGLEVKRSDFSQNGFQQLFLKDPAGLGVELNFMVPVNAG